MSHASITRTRSGCGCGCGGSSGKSGGCSCGGKAGLCEAQDIARPRFFAGQLLTEDDLDLLATYVVEKNRLHNRSLFGQGVVCGLEVTCDPCGGARITVQSGYALDCCGNDVVVPCPQTLDVNAMVKQLRIEKSGGVDCGDPCTDAKAKPAATPAATPDPAAMSTMPGAAGAAPDDQRPETPPLAGAQYCLYVRYCERLTDPVSPYATDDPCGAQVCEPTRVREGFTFELRCRDCDEPVPDNLFSRIKGCLDNLKSAEQTIRDARSLAFYNRDLASSLRLMQTEKLTRRFEAEPLEAVTAARQRVDELPDEPDKWTTAHAFEAAEAGQTLASHVAAWQSLTKDERDDLVKATPAIKTGVREAEAALGKLETKTPPQEELAKLIDLPLDRDIVNVTLRRAVLWKDREAALQSVPRGETRILAYGPVFTRGMQLSRPLAQMKANLINWLIARGPLTDCTLLRDVRAIVLPDDPTDAEIVSNAGVASDAATRLEDALWRYLRECFCTALNPPCPPCEDPAVLLACLRVEECQVVDICNLERTFVLTSTAVRYWMPFLGVFGDLLERACCPHDECDQRPKKAALVTAAAETRPSLVRKNFESRSAMDAVDRYMGRGMMLDPEHLAAVLPRKLSFSPDSARRLAASAAGMLDLATLRRGGTVGDILSPAVPAAVRARLAPEPLAGPTREELVVKLESLKAELDDLTKKHAAAERKVDARLKKLES